MVSAGRQGRRELQTTRVRIAFGPFPWVIDLWLPFMVYVSRIGFIAFNPFMVTSMAVDFLSPGDHMLDHLILCIT
jgi:hypothetical protein